mmetsp:Transcript_12323/g.1840  ORF Transcript_12323/g.1840 Transcript_12323/m.1840 type:complete len:99 (+) Transcript_12323:101-397(+)
MNFENISEEVRVMIGLTYNDIGKALYKGASFDQAITGFNEAINFDGLNPGFFLNRGDCYRAKGLLETALADYHHAMELEAPEKDLNPRLGLLHHTLGT